VKKVECGITVRRFRVRRRQIDAVSQFSPEKFALESLVLDAGPRGDDVALAAAAALSRQADNLNDQNQ
jgi:hypothetical protein